MWRPSAASAFSDKGAGSWGRIDGGQAEFVRVPYADQGLDRIPDGVSDRQALLVGDLLSTGYWAAQISEIAPEDTVLILGAGLADLCTLQCVRLLSPRRVIVCDQDPQRLAFARAQAPEVLTASPEGLAAFVRRYSDHGGADAVLEAATASSWPGPALGQTRWSPWWRCMTGIKSFRCPRCTEKT